MASKILPLRHDPKSTHQAFPELRSFVLTFHAGASGRDVSRAFCAVIESIPEFTSYDLIEDLTEFSGEVSHADVQAIADCHAQRQVDDAEVRYSVIVTPDVNYRFWLPALDHLFPGRRHLLVARLEDAWEELNRLRGR